MKNTLFISIILLTVLNLNSCTSLLSHNSASKSSLDIQIDDLSKQFVKTLSNENKSTLAIMDFVDLDGSQSMFGKYLREELTIRIFRTNKVSVVERGMLEEVMEEWNFGAKGFVSEKTASRIGQLLGVEAITIGTITDLGEDIKINARIIEVETGKLISVASVNLIKDSTILTLLKKDTETSDIANNDKLESKNKSSEELESSVIVKHEVKSKLSFIEKGMKFDIVKSEFVKGSNYIKLEGTITALETDKVFIFRPRALQAITDNGNSYYGEYMKVGLIIPRHSNDTGIIDLVAGIPTSLEIKIGSFESTPSIIKRLKIAEYWKEKDEGELDYLSKPNLEITLID